jgi:SNF2 family DNA or RNA helicase
MSSHSTLALEYRLVDNELTELLAEDKEERAKWLLLEEHPDFQDHWLVQAFSGAFFFDLKEEIGPYRAVSPTHYQRFATKAHELGYQIAFFSCPKALMEKRSLTPDSNVEIASDLEGTINGFLPYQIEGFNFLKDVDGGVAVWSTGTGKTVLAAALLKYHLVQEDFDLAFFVVKNHNKVNTQRSLKRLTDIDSIILEGSKAKREKMFSNLVHAAPGTVVVTNYEKFRADRDAFKALFESQRIICIWDEMPTKLKTRNTQIYKSVCECLYKTPCPAVDWNRKRPSSLRQWMLSATPIENSPEDFFNTVRLLDPRIYGTVNDFYDQYVSSFSFFAPSQPDTWHNLDKMGLKAAHVTHQVDKSDPDIEDQFPRVIEEGYYIDWNEKDRRIYDMLTKKAVEAGLDDVNVLAAITVMQMMCDAPSMIANSAALRESYDQALEAWLEYRGQKPSQTGSEAAWRLVETLGVEALTDDRHTKLDTLRELLTEVHSDEKVLVFSAFNDALMPILEKHFSEWGVTYVRYHGSDTQKQAAQDAFADDNNVQVFLSSDAGSDSLSLEQASVVIHYDLPWKWSTFIQRQNRIHRVVSKFEKVRYYTLQMADSVEDRKVEIIQRKSGYHQSIFQGEEKNVARLNHSDFKYILTGDPEA